ncbi:hypothetical protein HYY73_02170 [Candidatus Woesearchaeota archaeon]|nr:hypothetical protein [Candidatus Woesearchaeota archaeon]
MDSLEAKFGREAAGIELLARMAVGTGLTISMPFVMAYGKLAMEYGPQTGHSDMAVAGALVLGAAVAGLAGSASLVISSGARYFGLSRDK